MFGKINKALAAAAGLVLAGTVQAQTAYDGITAAVDWSDVVTGVTAVAALLAAVYVVIRGSKMLLRMIGR